MKITHKTEAQKQQAAPLPAKRVSRADAVSKSAATLTLPTLGTLSWWTVSALTLSALEAEQHADSVGLSRTMLLKLKTARRAFIAACRTVQSSLHQFDPAVVRSKRILVRKLRDQDALTQFAFVIETVPAQADVDPLYETIGRMTLDNKNGAEQVSELGSANMAEFEPLAKQIRKTYEQLRSSYDEDDIRRMVLRAVNGKMLGVGIRSNGGIYFTPRDSDEELSKLTAFVNGLGGSSLFYRLGIVDAENARESIAASLADEVRTEMGQELTKMQNKKDDGVDVKSTTLTKRLNRVRALKLKVERYESLLRVGADKLKAELDAAQDAINVEVEAATRSESDKTTVTQ